MYGMDMIIDLKGGGKGVIEAQIDTGAAANFITETLLKDLETKADQEFARVPIRKLQYDDNNKHGKVIDHDTIRTFNGGVFNITHTVRLCFRAGSKEKWFHNTEFEVLNEKERKGTVRQHFKNNGAAAENSQPTAVNNGKCDILLGAPFLAHGKILSVNPEFDCSAPEEWERLERRVVPLTGDTLCFEHSFFNHTTQNIQQSTRVGVPRASVPPRVQYSAVHARPWVAHP